MEIKKVFLIPHFHFDFEWWKEEPHHEEDALIIIDKALELLNKYPNFTYVIDQVAPLKFFIEKNPNRISEIKKYIDEGRLELVGGGIVAPDENLPTGEGLIRQFYEGKKWIKENIGVDVEVGWEIDEFGHPTQIPQILSILDFKYFVFSRGVNPYDKDHPTLFWWKDPAGEKKILTYWWAASYMSCSPIFPTSKMNIKRFFREIKARIIYEGKRSPVPYLMVPLGGDFTIPTADWIKFVDLWNGSEEIQLEFSLPSKFFKFVEKFSIPEVQGEFNPVFTGCYSSREKLKKRGRELQYRLSSFEKLSTISNILGDKYPEEKLKESWWEVLKGDFHDTICGTGTDRVYKKSLKRYDNAENILNECEEKFVKFLGKKLKGDYFVFNSLNWGREEFVQTDKISGIVKVPPLGIKRLEVSHEEKYLVKVTPKSLENRYLRLEFDEEHGLKSIYDKEKKFEILSGIGNEIIIEGDVGNLWTTAITDKKFKVKIKGIEIKKNTKHVGIISIKEGNDFIDIEKEIIILSNKKRVDFRTNIDFKGKDKRVDVCFPFAFNGKWFGEEPFHMLEKEEGTWALQNSAMYKGQEYGVGILNKGIPGYSFQANNCRLTLFRSVSLSSFSYVVWLIKNLGKIARLAGKSISNFKKGLNVIEYPIYPVHNVILREWATEGDIKCFGTTDLKSHFLAFSKVFKEALCWERGKHAFEYSILMDVKDTKDAIKEGLEINNPLWLNSIKGNGNIDEFTLFKDEVEGVVVSSIYPTKDGLLLRCYEIEGKKKEVIFPFNINITKVYKLERLDGKLNEIPLETNSFSYEFKPWEITNFLLVN